MALRAVGYPEAVSWQERSDQELMRGLRRRDPGAFEALYDRYARLIFSTAYRVLREAQGAEDVTQEVFLRLWRAPERYVEERGKLLGWLLSVTRNRAIDEVRARRRQPLPESLVANPEDGRSPINEAPSEAAAAALATVDLTDQREWVRLALAELPEQQRQAIELAYYKGLTQAEIATMLHTPLGTIKTRIRLGMQKLRVALEGRVGIVEPVPATGAPHPTPPVGTEGG